ncbi:MAG: type II toxin-antitoxin system HicB family antitoxin [Elusimicrobia bacterium]|nr:type II toxin-antitoxin system HicB family antitoxin [Elusimicrobiota bacterium]
MSNPDLYERKVFHSKEDKGWIAAAPELPGCSAFGRTPAKALKELDTAIELWLETAKSKKWRVPAPLAEKKAAGRVLLRLPKALHEEYLSMSAEEGVSLNQYMLYVLARYRELGHLARHVR